jgi:hypothetical protein
VDFQVQKSSSPVVPCLDVLDVCFKSQICLKCQPGCLLVQPGSRELPSTDRGCLSFGESLKSSQKSASEPMPQGTPKVVPGTNNKTKTNINHQSRAIGYSHRSPLRGRRQGAKPLRYIHTERDVCFFQEKGLSGGGGRLSAAAGSPFF